MSNNNSEPREIQKRLLRHKIYIIVGCIFVGLGFMGVFVPLMPTTPFLLVSLFCFSRSSQTNKEWLINHKILGPYVSSYVDNGIMPVKIKVRTLILMWSVCIMSGIFATDSIWVRMGLGVMATCVTIHIALKKSK